ncbi:lipopolysaccharide biosynthesis protein [Algibacter mikhailovii]|uniref:O-antigen export protein n=1 Tax=Algibacter mikhailovii TaxID=425498 RepID=A0A918RA42_9FLAO|nr:MATE family efflux transporter [Algibacter mikhailovii]GGZ89310.1 O-antigen export protein [Algibacter mikhailovii]
MKKKIIELLDRIGVKSGRTLNIVKHIAVSFFYKGGAVLANFLLVPLTINYLDVENYGVWLTLSSFISWFSFFDIGLGNGLRNKFAEAKAKNDYSLARAYISTAYYTITCISISLFTLFLIVNYFIDWTRVFNTSDQLMSDFSILMPVIIGLFCLQLIVKLISSVYLADQNHSIQVKIQFITQVLLLIIVWALTKTTNSSLLIYGIIFSALPVLVLLVLNLFGFSNRFRLLKPSIYLWNNKYLNEIMGVGLRFFIIQIAALVLFSTDNFIISIVFSPEEVVPYNIAFKYFSILTMAFSMLVAPYWSSFTDAYVKNDFSWIKISINNILKIWIVVPVGLVLMLFLADWFYLMWVGKEVVVPKILSLSMALFVLMSSFNSIFVSFINGVGKIKLQLVTAIISMVINIPLSIFFAKTLNFGVSGVMFATCFCLGYSVILRPIQYYRIINNKARGIWNK